MPDRAHTIIDQTTYEVLDELLRTETDPERRRCLLDLAADPDQLAAYVRSRLGVILVERMLGIR